MVDKDSYVVKRLSVKKLDLFTKKVQIYLYKARLWYTEYGYWRWDDEGILVVEPDAIHFTVHDEMWIDTPDFNIRGVNSAKKYLREALQIAHLWGDP